jgi:ribosomal protein S18 acetylase RimI-like enzyme
VSDRPEQPGIRFRQARPEDNQRCQQIAVAAWEPIYAGFRGMVGAAVYDHLYPDWPARKAGQIAASFERAPQHILVAEDEASGQVVGFVTYRLDPATCIGEIGNNAVDPPWQGRGLASAMYRRVLDVFRNAGMRVARVTTGLDPAHAPARAAYRRVGFTGEVPSVTMYQEL